MSNAEPAVKLVPHPDPSHPSEVADITLLDRFIANRDENAFASLLLRHGPMVLGVCRRVLGHAQDAEDAFQATFLVLARQAGRISRRASVGSWLHGVAYRVSLRARRTMSTRQVHEAAHIERASFDRMPGAEEQEFRLIVDEELHQLPAKFREPLVLCYLEGKTNEEAARELGCPAGTVFSRLARGRERLRKQLARRGLVLTAGLIAASLAAHSAPAAVPPVLAAATLKAATAFAIGTPAAVGTIAAGVVSLTDATIRTLFLLQLKHMAMIAVVAVVLAAGGGLITYSVYDAIFSERSTAARVDARQLQGIWRVVVQEQDGQELSQERLQSANSRMIFVGNQLSHRDTAPNGQDVGQDVTFTLDPTQSPKAIDLKRNGQKLFGIYELDGETLKVCVDKNPGHRPREFSTQKESQRILHVLKRADTAVPK